MPFSVHLPLNDPRLAKETIRGLFVRDDGVQCQSSGGNSSSSSSAAPAVELNYSEAHTRSAGGGGIMHLVQQEDVIMHLHREVIPPDIYYDKLKEILDEMIPGTSPGLLDHIVAFIAAGDTAAAFCVSFVI